MIFEAIGKNAHEQVSHMYDVESGYRGIIAVHDTTLGPALGGTRFWNYESDHAALVDTGSSKLQPGVLQVREGPGGARGNVAIRVFCAGVRAE